MIKVDLPLFCKDSKYKWNRPKGTYLNIGIHLDMNKSGNNVFKLLGCVRTDDVTEPSSTCLSKVFLDTLFEISEQNQNS